VRKKRVKPMEEAEHFVRHCIDKSCLQKRFIDEHIGLSLYS